MKHVTHITGGLDPIRIVVIDPLSTFLRPCVHFIGFKDDRFWNAVRIWGYPDFVHPMWDPRARREIGPEDIVVFAEGDDTQPLARFNATDFIEKEPPYDKRNTFQS